jgi:hypothetical protein
MSEKGDKFYYEGGTSSSEYDWGGVLHRIDGPAIETSTGHREWWISGEYYTEQEFNELIREINEMSVAMKLTDPRDWVRKLATL